jgi:hypothetical protein
MGTHPLPAGPAFQPDRRIQNCSHTSGQDTPTVRARPGEVTETGGGVEGFDRLSMRVRSIERLDNFDQLNRLDK